MGRFAVVALLLGALGAKATVLAQDDVTIRAKEGDRDAQFMMGNRVRFDQEHGGLTEAGRWYELAAIQGHAVAQNYLGMFYGGGSGGFPLSCKESLKWYTLAAEGGDFTSWSGVAWKLATCDDETIRDGARSLSILRERVTNIPDSGATLDIMAAAYAAMGDFRKARALQEAVIALAENRTESDHLATYRERLRLYEEGKIWQGPSINESDPFH